jgi:tetratricopeptide (TPR) repeat protein
VAVPPTIQALLAARLDQLDPGERGVLERGSVEGQVFHRGAVVALAPEEHQVDGRLLTLVRKDLVRPEPAVLPDDDAYRFRHLLIRDAAYEALPKATRAELHERFAAWLEEHGSELVELDEVVGYHLEQAYRYRAELGTTDENLGRHASARLAVAGRRALLVRDVAAASNLLRRAISLAPPSGRDGVELLLDLGSALVDRGEMREGDARREEAIALAQEIGDRTLELRARCELAILRLVTTPDFTGEQGLKLARSAIDELGPEGDDQALAGAWFLVVSAENLRAHWQAAQAAVEHVLEHARNPGDRWRGEALEFLGPAIFWSPTPVAEGLPRVQAILEGARGNKCLQAWSMRPVAGFYGIQGRFDEAREVLAEARTILQELGRKIDLVTLAFWTGPLERLAGNPVEAARVTGEACDFLEAAGERGWLSTMATIYASALCDQRRFDEAEAAAARSRDAATSDDFNAQSLWRVAMARALANQGRHEEAERLADEAIPIADRSDELNNQAETRTDAAEAYRLAGRVDKAVTALQEALERYEEKGNVVMARRTRALLEELR